MSIQLVVRGDDAGRDFAVWMQLKWLGAMCCLENDVLVGCSACRVAHVFQYLLFEVRFSNIECLIFEHWMVNVNHNSNSLMYSVYICDSIFEFDLSIVFRISNYRNEIFEHEIFEHVIFSTFYIESSPHDLWQTSTWTSWRLSPFHSPNPLLLVPSIHSKLEHLWQIAYYSYLVLHSHTHCRLGTIDTDCCHCSII